MPLSTINSKVYLDLLNSIKQEITKTQDEVQRQKARGKIKEGEGP
jgi:hypothetical protein